MKDLQADIDAFHPFSRSKMRINRYFVYERIMVGMRLVEKRDYIHSHLHQVDENVLNQIYKVIESKLQDQSHVVAYEANGTPITKAQYVQSIREAEDQIERGEFTTLEDLEEESKSW